MVEKTRELIEKVNEIKDKGMGFFSVPTLLKVGPEDFFILKSMVELLDISMSLIQEQAEMMDAQTEILNTLLALSKKEES